MQLRTVFAGIVLFAGSVASIAVGADVPTLDQRYETLVQPFLKTHCLACHGPKKQEGKLDLSGYSSAASIAEAHKTWEIVLDRLEAGDMPPEKAPSQPTEVERNAVIAWVRSVRDREAKMNAGDPGPVLARRLSNAEYDNTIRDLTGVDLRPTREFPVDPANEAGFDNSGESLTMSPALVKKFLDAARSIADHLVFKPDGLEFSPDPAITDTDRDKYCVHQIVDFYDRHRVDYADYFMACWTFRHRDALGKPAATLADIAAESRLSPRYLATLWTTLTDTRPETGPLGETRVQWRALPADPSAKDEARRGSERLRDLVIRLRKGFEPRVPRMQARGISAGSQPFVLWKNRRLAELRMSDTGDNPTPDRQEFCRVFPDAFSISDRAPYFDAKGGKSGRLLTAGFHLMQGYFRDDAPLYELVLDESDRHEIDGLWRELNIVTRAPIRQYKDFIFFERAEPPQFLGGTEFDFARSEDKAAISEAKIGQLKTAYLGKARRLGASAEAIAAIETYFTDITSQIRQVEQGRLAAEPEHRKALENIASRAYRRPLTTAERDDLLASYRAFRAEDGTSHEDAIRDSLVVILMSPQFLYRSDPAGPGAASQPLSDYALASRLSYFLWSSMPDKELLAHAATGDLHRRDVLIAQTRRMLRDARVRGLATEFAGNWLDFRRFEEHNGVDRGRFTAFTNDLRRAMFEEPVRFVVDVATSNRSVLDLLDADHTFVNPVLARHYGMPVPTGGPDVWTKVDGARRYGRGGLLPMAVFLTRNSPGLRTSPVKRGYWVVRRVLGEEIPAPPPAVPELPKDESKSGDLSLPQLLARHRDDKSCMGCHKRFDSIGLIFEGYGPVGERRDRDLGGRPIDAKATFPDDSQGEGLDGLRRYLDTRRRDDFVTNLCRKLFSYALGRTLVLSDEPTIAAMKTALSADESRFGGLVESIVTSPQFLNKRGADDPRDR
jgi:mono/diheme cytochrome c family protein